MKKGILFGLFTFLFTIVYAKDVRFSVDMSGQTISPNGVHISGDFQDEAGFPKDWDSKSTVLKKESGTDIYSVVVQIPAFRKYEYKFVNGDMFYEVEFVPEKSRIGFDFNDNRWIYIDSLSMDTLQLPKLLFGGNAPSGQKMIRFKVDLTTQNSNHSNGIHVGSTLNNWNPKASNMISFSGKTYESIEFVDTNEIEYIFINGFAYEKLNPECSNANKKRYLTIASDTILKEVCFNECQDCIDNVVNPKNQSRLFTLYPNPANGHTILKIANSLESYSVVMKDYKGSQIKSFENVRHELIIATEEIPDGLYFIEVKNKKQVNTIIKLLIN